MQADVFPVMGIKRKDLSQVGDKVNQKKQCFFFCHQNGQTAATVAMESWAQKDEQQEMTSGGFWGTDPTDLHQLPEIAGKHLGTNDLGNRIHDVNAIGLP